MMSMDRLHVLRSLLSPCVQGPAPSAGKWPVRCQSAPNWSSCKPGLMAPLSAARPAARHVFGPPFPFVRHASSLKGTSLASSASSASSVSSAPSHRSPRVALPALDPEAANPPATTLPPPLELPQRGPSMSTASYLMATGKAYLGFYKTGLMYLRDNWRLVRALPPAHHGQVPTTRSELLLRRRWQHDIRRLPQFGLLLLLCGELTPLVVMVFPHVVPYPCRIPKQVAQLRRSAEARRRRAFADVGEQVRAAGLTQVPDALVYTHIARSLGLVSKVWDKLPGGVPAGLARWHVLQKLRQLAIDDALLWQSGGADALSPEELRLACEGRGLDVLGVPDDRLRHLLTRWLELVNNPSPLQADNANAGSSDETRMILLALQPDTWPEK